VVDHSIQPGDGGVGITLDVAAFKGINRFTLFGTATYLVNPRNTNGVLTGRRRVPDIRDLTHGDAAFADYLITVGYCF
jgi:hypothetical protein